MIVAQSLPDMKRPIFWYDVFDFLQAATKSPRAGVYFG
jgi:hypothetical protein